MESKTSVHYHYNNHICYYDECEIGIQDEADFTGEGIAVKIIKESESFGTEYEKLLKALARVMKSLYRHCREKNMDEEETMEFIANNDIREVMPNSKFAGCSLCDQFKRFAERMNFICCSILQDWFCHSLDEISHNEEKFSTLVALFDFRVALSGTRKFSLY